MKKVFIDVPGVGEILNDEFLTPLGLSQNALAKAIGVPANRINEIVNGTRSMTADTDLRLCRYFGLTEGYFLRIQDSVELVVAKQKNAESIAKIIPFEDIQRKNKAKLKPVEELEEA